MFQSPGSGIGAEVSVSLSQKGFNVLGCGRRLQPLEDIQKRAGPQMNIVSADMSTEEGRLAVYNALPDDAKVSILVQNAAVVTPAEPLMTVDLDQYRNMMETNVEGPLHLSQLLVPRMVYGARILQVSSGAAHKSYPSMGPYCISKAAFHSLYQGLALELADPEPSYASVYDRDAKDTDHESKRHVLCGSAAPGVVDTPMQDTLRSQPRSSFPLLDFWRGLKTEEKLTSPQEVAAFYDFLLFDTTDDEFIASDWDIRHPDHQSRWK